MSVVQVRRRAIETERQTRFQEMAERRRQRASEFELRQQEKEKERVEAARAKERDREERLAALNKQQKAHIEELQKKIQLKVSDVICVVYIVARNVLKSLKTVTWSECGALSQPSWLLGTLLYSLPYLLTITGYECDTHLYYCSLPCLNLCQNLRNEYPYL